MNYYDYKRAKELIEEHKPKSAYMGMKEDWGCTAVRVYANGEFLIDLTEEPDIAGINGSNWATPTLDLEFEDGTETTTPIVR